MTGLAASDCFLVNTFDDQTAHRAFFGFCFRADLISDQSKAAWKNCENSRNWSIAFSIARFRLPTRRRAGVRIRVLRTTL